ncbi:hypothetical protein NDU88_005021, partial [Pleurodeles waltl]
CLVMGRLGSFFPESFPGGVPGSDWEPFATFSTDVAPMALSCSLSMLSNNSKEGFFPTLKPLS